MDGRAGEACAYRVGRLPAVHGPSWSADSHSTRRSPGDRSGSVITSHSPPISPSSPLYPLHDRRVCPQLLAVSASPVTVGHTAVTRRDLPANALAGSVHCTVTVSQRVSLHRPQPVRHAGHRLANVTCR